MAYVFVSAASHQGQSRLSFQRPTLAEALSVCRHYRCSPESILHVADNGYVTTLFASPQPAPVTRSCLFLSHNGLVEATSAPRPKL